MAAQTQETERKYDVPRRWACPPLAGVGAVSRVEGPRRFTQTATYLDTPSLDLLRAKRTLRRRVGGIDAGWHLKLPGGGDTRTEVHEPLGSSAARVPASLRSLVADVIGNAALVPVAVLRTRRARRELLDASGALVAEIVDDTVEATVLLDGERILRWREVELELGPAGTTEDLEAVHAALVGSRLVGADSPSKLSRALAEPLAARAGASAKKRTAGDVVLAYLTDQLGVMQAFEPAVREDAPDAVHKMRVATRRARSALKTFRDLFDPSIADDLRSELAWIAALLGGPRDAEVLLERLERDLDAVEPRLVVGPVRERILGMLRADHDAGRRALVAGLDSKRYERLLAELTEAVQRPPYLGDLAHEPAGDVIAKLSGRAAAKVVKTAAMVEKVDPAERDVVIHEIRKKAKAARYADEAATPVLGKKGAAPAWTKLQEALGDYQDGVVAVEALERAWKAARAAGEDTFTYGVLIEREGSAARAIRARYGDLLAAALAKGKKAKG